MNYLEETDRKDLICKQKQRLDISGDTRKHCENEFAWIQNSKAKVKKKKQGIDIWNWLKKVINANNVQLKEKLDKYRYGDRTTRTSL